MLTFYKYAFIFFKGTAYFMVFLFFFCLSALLFNLLEPALSPQIYRLCLVMIVIFLICEVFAKPIKKKADDLKRSAKDEKP